MNNEFVSYEIALALKKLGFNEPCFGKFYYNQLEIGGILTNNDFKEDPDIFISAPLCQQVFRWFREKYDLYSHVRESLGFDNVLEFVSQINGSYVNHGIKDKPINRFETYEEAELTCLQKMIEIVTNNKMTNKEKFLALVSEEDDQTLVEIKERIKNRELKNEKISDETISKTLQDFDVFSYSICNTDDPFKYYHWTKGLKMIITKNGVTIELGPDEIQQLVNTLPRTFSQSYKQKN